MLFQMAYADVNNMHALTYFMPVYLFFEVTTHSTCEISWNFNVGCKKVRKMIIEQILTWSENDGCDKQGGMKCLYQLKSKTAEKVTATHETPKEHYVDELTFTFYPVNTTCTVQGISTSEAWYEVLDYTNNYCNLQNLIYGAGLHHVPGYKEKTNDQICKMLYFC